MLEDNAKYGGKTTNNWSNGEVVGKLENNERRFAFEELDKINTMEAKVNKSAMISMKEMVIKNTHNQTFILCSCPFSLIELNWIISVFLCICVH